MTKPPVVDFHVHFLEKEALEKAQGKTVLTGFGARPPATATGAQRTMTLDKMLRPERQIEDMDRLGIDVNVISLSTVIGGTAWADARTELDLVKRCNDRAAEGAPHSPSASSARSCSRCRTWTSPCASSSALRLSSS